MTLTSGRYTTTFAWLFIVYAAMVMLPSLPVPLGTGWDASWMIGLNRAHAAGLVAGRDVVFTYGPLGYLLSPEPGYASSAAALVYGLAFWAATVAAMARLAQTGKSRVASLCVIFFLTLSVLVDQGNVRVTAFIAMALVCLRHSRWRYVEAGALGLMASVGLLTKFNEGIEGITLWAIALATIVIRDWPLGKRNAVAALSAAAILPVAAGALFRTAGGPIAELPAFLCNSFQIANGYSDAMSLDGPAWQPIVGVLGVAIVLAAALGLTEQPRDIAVGIAPMLAAAFFAFKWSMVRQDAYHAGRLEMRIALAGLFLLISAKSWRDRKPILMAQLLLVFLNVALIGLALRGSAEAANTEAAPVSGNHGLTPGAGPSHLAESRVKRLLFPPAHVLEYLHWGSNWQRVQRANAAALEGLRLDPESQRVVGNGTVDAMGWEIDRVVANGWRWRPRPVIQSYSAYTPKLDELNARRLKAAGADYLLLGFTTVDDRHPLFEQPLNWLAALAHYRLVWQGCQLALLRRRETARESQPETIGRATTTWNEAISAPTVHENVLLLHAHLKPSVWGMVAKIAFHLSPVYLTVTLRSGHVIKRRLVPETASAGIIVAPFPMTLAEACALFRGDFQTLDAVTSVRLEATAPVEFQTPIEIEWSSVRLPDSR